MPIIKSKLDTDLYKLCMAQLVLHGGFAGMHFRDIEAEYSFINRGTQKFSEEFVQKLRREIDALADLPTLTPKEMSYLATFCPFVSKNFLEWYSAYHFDPKEVTVALQEDGQLRVTITGPWSRTIFWEVPLMALISELYFQDQQPDKQWENRCRVKAEKMAAAGLTMGDFGTRRRFSRAVQESVIDIIRSVFFNAQSKNHVCRFTGTSNVDIACQRGIKCLGTHGHEIFMAMGAIFGYRFANRITMQCWQDEFRGSLGIALSDTYTTDVFFRDFDAFFARLFDGIREDSSRDLHEFIDKTIIHYSRLLIDPLSKTILFSNNLTDDKAIDAHNYCRGRIKCAFGIGTFLTNDCGTLPLNMVIKLTAVRLPGREWVPTVKLSDSPGKYTGDPKEVEICKNMLGIKE